MKTKKNNRTEAVKNSFFEKVNSFFERHEKTMIYWILAIGFFTSLLLFDTKVSLSGDDCDYIVAAGQFWNHFTYPGHHGPLYSIILSPFVGIFGINLVFLKLLSTLFIVSSFWFFYKGFRRIVPSLVLIPSLLLVSINPYVLFFSSYTYSEPLYLFMQALFFYFFSKYFWQSNMHYTFKKDWKKYLILVLVIIGMGLTRTVGFCTIGIIMLYFMLERRWQDLLYTVGIFAFLFGLFYVLKPLIWPDSSTVQSFGTLLAIDPYNPALGLETVAGLFERVIDNSHVYLSGFLFKYLGFRSASDLPLKDIPLLSVATYVLFITCIFTLFKKNKALLFTGFYAGTMLFTNFVLLHEIWSQDRFLMVYYPFILLFLFGGFYFLFVNKRVQKTGSIYLLLLVAVLIGTGIHAKIRIGRNIPILQQNLLGNDLYGLTPDWENFIKMSRWANDKLEKDAVIVSRKPSISYVYTGREFMGIFNVPYMNVHEIAENSRAEKTESQHLIVELGENRQIIGSLRPHLQYIFISKTGTSHILNNREITAALVFKTSKDMISEELAAFMDANQMNYSFDYDLFLQQYVEDQQIRHQIIDPDVLLNHLIDNHVRYLILAKIRLYTAENTGHYINTIHQYISLISMKYPNLFGLIHTIGKDETCELVEFIEP
jgi:hypothetical protein